ncbi:Heparinase II/III-like protein [Parapedobacter composti]|uniref:Heparinase II/III-like protein n=2 Tax=Parapedobacter composti TaxID=623281 RepID=A0A1I1JDD3_9SPHI|nr:Heparinase II/III-like protein [Parapedobacter composti]
MTGMNKIVNKLLTGALALLMCHYAVCTENRNLLQNAATESQVRTSLILNQEWVPYPDYTDREAWSRLTDVVSEQLIAEGEKYLDFEWRVVKATDYIEFERSGSRATMETPFGANSNALSALVLAELCEGKGRFLDQIVNGVWLFSEMSSWALSAHLPGPQRSHRSLPDDSGHVIDLAAGDIGSLLSWTYHFFKASFDEVNPSISHRLLNTLKERILETYMARDDFWWQAFNLKAGAMVNNWNPWCNFNVLACFLLLEDDPEKLAAGVYRTMRSVDAFINYNHSDGACEEGPSYWSHAAGKLYDYLQLLSYATAERITIFHEPIVRNMGEYIARSYVGDGWVVNFADASAKGGGNMSLIYRYGQAVNSTEMQQFAGYLYNRSGKRFSIAVGRDVFRALEAMAGYPGLSITEPALPTFKFAWYAETEFCYLKNEDGLFLAAKGGHNNESHNHNDIGTFSLYIKHIPFFVDAGVGTYTRQTFSNERYSIWTMQSAYHNVPRINGFDQRFGASYRSREVRFDERKMEFSLDIAGAYPSEAKVKQWKRRYRLDGKTVYITDEYRLAEAARPNQLHFLTWAKPDLSIQGEARLTKEGKQATLFYNPNQFSAETEVIELSDPRLTGVWGECIYRLVLKEKKARTKGTYRFRISAL